MDLLAVQGTLKSFLQHHSSKPSILRRSALFTVQLSHPYMTTGKTIALTRWTFVGKVTSYTPIQNKVFFNKVRILGMEEENQHSMQRKQGAGVRRKETGSEENYGHTFSFRKNYIEVWLIFSVALRSAAQQCDSVIHIKIYFFLIIFHGTYR